ncbi:uncharacterized protein LOC111703845 isoform X7 [Eurytemora carolleeae]|uniref:uncharacterized protein LOC111703845 isoform X6 n=1 Tax=Eurytemora carolleeae TaxID=1294199 RepID=UPI000C772B02|nr:uncharacterized protein LOC111703845 isoform X6 [Eurytemora carolleeae]XP_023331686.1 uncharacterized protein LOC111703845 isoform X7 [Eurytemora carolleeae]|eukprot:XP_023331685.1 uncharacterized protein LOC111703845 isoform X6 [Eurytemora affinis]
MRKREQRGAYGLVQRSSTRTCFLHLLLILSTFSQCFAKKGNSSTSSAGDCQCSPLIRPDQEICKNFTFSSTNITEDLKETVIKCLKVPWLAVIVVENPKITTDRLESVCLGSIINKKYILSTASCFCNKKLTGLGCDWNDSVPGKKLPSGHFTYTGGTKGSRITYDHGNFVKVMLSGKIFDFSLKNILEVSVANTSGTEKVARIILHPEYVEGKRDQSDIALIELQQEIVFDSENIFPICLPGVDSKDYGVQAKISGWGTLYERYAVENKIGCHTNVEGPAKFEKCRQEFVLEGDIMGQCLNSAPPVWLSEECMKLHSEIPDAAKNLSVIKTNHRKITCYPTDSINSTDNYGWCATCVEDAAENEPGYCSAATPLDAGTENTSSVGHNSAWGMCDSKCSVRDTDKTLSTDIVESSIYILTKQECINRTRGADSLAMKARVDRELCAISSLNETVSIFEQEKDGKYKRVDEENRITWGGSSSCQVDSGSSLYTLDSELRPTLLGIASRVSNCSLKNVNVLYSRVIHYLDWINSTTGELGCSVSGDKN